MSDASILDAVLSALDYPLRKAKEAVSGDEAEWYAPAMDPSTLDHHLYAAGNTAADLLLDPLNFVGGAAVKGLKGAKQLPGAVASISNYIPNHYGPGSIPSKSDELLGSLLGKHPRLKNASPEQLAMAGQKIGSAGKWAGDSLMGGMKHMADPRSRALWSEQGITKPAQGIIDELMGLKDETVDQLKLTGKSRKLDSRAEDKAIAQSIYLQHIAKQGDHVPSGLNPGLDEINKRAFVESYSPATVENVSTALQTHKVMDDLGRAHGASPAEADYAAKRMMQLQGVKPGDQFVLKAPAARETGGHFHDLVYNNPANTIVKEMFSELADEAGNVGVPQMSRFLQDAVENGKNVVRNAKAGNKETARWTVDTVDPDGVWLRGTKVGSAIVEGGVGFLMKLHPDGTMKVFMNDAHDFVEKVIPTAQKGIIPTGVTAFTPPMVSNIKTLKKGIKAKLNDAAGNTIYEPPKILKSGKPSKRRKARTQTLEGPKFTQVPSRGTTVSKGGRSYTTLLDEVANATPSKAGVAKEAGALAGEALLLQRLFDNETNY